MNFWHVGVLYYRDKADQMKQPTLDRIDNTKDYTYENCQFLELIDHNKKTHIGSKRTAEQRRRISKAHIGVQRGEKHGNSRFKEKDIKYIRSSCLSGVQLAKKYGVRRSTVSNILHRRTWGWL